MIWPMSLPLGVNSIVSIISQKCQKEDFRIVGSACVQSPEAKYRESANGGSSYSLLCHPLVYLLRLTAKSMKGQTYVRCEGSTISRCLSVHREKGFPLLGLRG